MTTSSVETGGHIFHFSRYLSPSSPQADGCEHFSAVNRFSAGVYKNAREWGAILHSKEHRQRDP